MEPCLEKFAVHGAKGICNSDLGRALLLTAPTPAPTRTCHPPTG